MKFANIYYLISIVVWLPLIILFFTAAKRKRAKFFNHFSKFQQQNIISLGYKKLLMKRVVILSALILLTIAAIRPQMGESEVNIASTGIDVAVIFDVSLSMLAEDEQGARFLKGRRMLIDAVSEMDGDRIALIPFAGSAFLQLPLTAINVIYSKL